MRFVALLFVFNLLGAVLGQNPEALDAQRCTEVEACARCEGASQELITCRREALMQAEIQRLDDVRVSGEAKTALLREWEEDFRNEWVEIEKELQERQEERKQEREEMAKEWEEKQRIKAKEIGIQKYGTVAAWEEAEAKSEIRKRYKNLGWFVLFSGLVFVVIWRIRRTPYYYS